MGLRKKKSQCIVGFTVGLAKYKPYDNKKKNLCNCHLALTVQLPRKTLPQLPKSEDTEALEKDQAPAAAAIMFITVLR